MVWVRLWCGVRLGCDGGQGYGVRLAWCETMVWCETGVVGDHGMVCWEAMVWCDTTVWWETMVWCEIIVWCEILVWWETMVWCETLDAHVNATVVHFEQYTLFIHPFYAFIRLFISVTVSSETTKKIKK